MTQPSESESKMKDKLDNPQIADRQSSVASPTGGATIDAEARTAIDLLITRLEAHGLIADN